MATIGTSTHDLERELSATRRELEEARALLAAIRTGEADAVVIETAAGRKVYTPRSAGEPYRTLVETLKEGAVTATGDGVILYCNDAFMRLAGRDSGSLIGASLAETLGSEVAAALTSNGGTAGLECTVVGADGSRRECLISSVPHQADGETVWCMLVGDVTGQALRLRHTAIVESADDAVVSIDRSRCITTWNPAAQALFGYSAAEVVGMDAELLAAPGDAAGAFGQAPCGAIDAALLGHGSQSDTRRIAKDGRVIDVSLTASPIRAPDGAIIGAAVVMRDIGARKRAEERVKESEARLRLATAAAKVGAFDWNMRTGVNTWTPELEAIYGLLPGEFGRTQAAWEELIHPDDRAAAVAKVDEAIATGEPVEHEWRIARHNAGTRWIAARFQAVKDATGVAVGLTGVNLDITERKQIEMALAASEERLRFVADRAQVGYWHWDIPADRLDWSPLCRRLFGVLAQEPVSYARFLAALHPEDRGRTDRAVRACLGSEGKTGYDIDFRAVWPNGTVRWIHAKGDAVVADGRPIRMAGIALDITARKQAETEGSRLAAIVASSSEAIVSKTLDGTITSWNAAAERIFGYSGKEMIGASIRSIVPPDRQTEEDDILARISRGERIENYETVRLRKDGRYVDVSVTISPIFDERGNIVGASKIAHDISEKKRAEERERLLMREVNHRSKNMLTLVQSIARQTAATGAQDFVERFSLRVHALAACQDVLVNSGWHNVPIEALVRAQLGHFDDLVERRIRLSGPSLEINAAAAQAIGLALHELATNAAKYGALSNDSGVVHVSWALGDGDAEPCFVLSWSEAGGPVVARPARRGFGSTVTGSLVKMSLDGEVETDYAPGGLQWRLSCSPDMVLEKARAPQRAKAASVRGEAKARNKRILVVEDEPLIAVEIATMLERAGFQVVGPVGTVDHALALFEHMGCDAAVLDANLGSETAKPVAERLVRARIPFVTISGYGRDQLPSGFGSAPYFGKPLNSAGIINCLKQCLDGAEAKRTAERSA